MPRFVFPLEAALEQRQRLERDRQIVVAQLQREASLLEDRIRVIQGEIVREKQELRSAVDAERAGGVVDLASARRQGAASLARIREAQGLALQLAGMLKRLDQARLDLLEAARRRAAVQMLRDRRYDEWKRQQSRRETSELDEIAVMRAGRQSAAHGDAA
jgi:flagellar export protein FliJ